MSIRRALPAVVSVAAHLALGLVLRGVGGAEAARAPRTVEVDFVRPVARTEPVAEPPREARPAPSRRRIVMPPAPPRGAPTPEVPPAPPMAVATTEPAQAGEDAVVVPEAPAEAPSGTGAPQAIAPPKVTSAAPSGGGGTVDLSGYLGYLNGSLAAHRNYPPMAVQLGLEGTVEVLVKVRKDGTLAARPSVVGSSGHTILDEEALRMVARAAPFRALPTGWGPAVAELKVPVRFYLEN